ncbi:Uncharacterised protein [Vibrio cholerae]|nr:Uncharacterised protein [Vibrio cholerae]
MLWHRPRPHNVNPPDRWKQFQSTRCNQFVLRVENG